MLGRRAGRAFGLAAALAASAFWPSGARAQGTPAERCAGPAPPPPEAPYLCRNDFAIDLHQGPVLAPTRVIGLAGAYAALGDGADGLGQNAAASVVRPPYSTNWFDYDITLGASLTGAFGRTDFDNSGDRNLAASTFFYTLGGLLQFGRFGVGLLGDFQRYEINGSARVTVGRLHATAGYSLLDNQLQVAGGLRGVTTLVTLPNPNGGFLPTNALTIVGFAPQVGALFSPNYLPWRLGATFRAPVSAETGGGTVEADGVRRAASLAVPREVHWPWEFELGAALSAGPRPLNPRWIDPSEQERRLREPLEARRAERARALERELGALPDAPSRYALRLARAREEAALREGEERRYRADVEQLAQERRARYLNWPRPRVLVVAELLITGDTEGGIGLRSFLDQRDVPSGRRVTTQPRLGLEGEPVVGLLITRVGTYLEPTRYEVPPGSSGLVAGARQHFTAGVEVKLFPWDVFGTFPQGSTWRITGVADIAPRYENIGLSVGLWH
ncbi:MAG TPA: hypothetical protein VFS43_22030 [Polyangiaceae bacterium]|nr:hypothetical protein [Polyangiaceae bacterium]